MSSDDVSSDRISTEMLERLIRRSQVADLAPWTESPWSGYDLGAQTVRDSVFGKLRLPIVFEGEVLWGSDIVDAERIEPKDGGSVLVIDLTDTGWSRSQATAAVLGEATALRQMTTDDTLLAELVTALARDDMAMLEAAGWDGDDVDQLIGDLTRVSDGAFGEDEDKGSVACPNCGVIIPLGGET